MRCSVLLITVLFELTNHTRGFFFYRRRPPSGGNVFSFCVFSPRSTSASPTTPPPRVFFSLVASVLSPLASSSGTVFFSLFSGSPRLLLSVQMFGLNQSDPFGFLVPSPNSQPIFDIPPPCLGLAFFALFNPFPPPNYCAPHIVKQASHLLGRNVYQFWGGFFHSFFFFFCSDILHAYAFGLHSWAGGWRSTRTGISSPLCCLTFFRARL